MNLNCDTNEYFIGIHMDRELCHQKYASCLAQVVGSESPTGLERVKVN